MRGACAALLVVLLATPHAAAVVDEPTWREPPPCLGLNVTVDGAGAWDVYPSSPCQGQQVNFTWVADPEGGWGELDVRARLNGSANPLACLDHTGIEWLFFYFPGDCSVAVFSAAPPEPFDASLLGALRRWARSWSNDPEQPPPAPIARFDGADPGPMDVYVVVSARFRVAWGAHDCADSRGEFEASVNEHRAASEEPRGLFESLCRLSRSDAPTISDIGHQVAGVAALVLETVARGVPRLSPSLEPVIAGLGVLAIPTLPRMPDAPGGSDPRHDLPAPPGPPDATIATPDAPDVTIATMGGADATPTTPEPTVAPASERAPSVTGDITTTLAPANASTDVTGEFEANAGMRASVAGGLSVGDGPPADPAGDPLGVSSHDPGASAFPAPSTPATEPSPLTVPASFADAEGPSEGTRRATGGLPARGVLVQAWPSREGDGGDAGRLSAAVAAGALATILAGFALYQRLAPPAALDHPIRAALYAACVKRGRGTSARELGEEVGVGRTTAEYHLAYLAKLGLLRADRDAKDRRLFAPPASAPPPPQERLEERVLALVRGRAEVDLPTVAGALGVTRFRADRCLKELLLQGRIASRWAHGRRAYSGRDE